MGGQNQATCEIFPPLMPIGTIVAMAAEVVRLQMIDCCDFMRLHFIHCSYF